MQPLIITLDGPAGSGKSTMARQLARRLGLSFLDTGAMYRALAVLCLELGVDVDHDPQAVIAAARGASFHLDWSADPPGLSVAHAGVRRDVTARLRDADVTHGASVVAALGPVRQVLVAAQQAIGREHPRLVSEGRDQGSVVFPDAQVKFYLDARPAVRARRRALELRQGGRDADEAMILQEIIRRDQRDSTRTDGPLVCPADAVRLDTSDLSREQVMDLLEKTVRQIAGSRLAPAGPGGGGGRS